jgi:predicted MFS family arabinose efflux permease
VVDRVDYLKMLRLTQALTFVHSAVLAVLTLSGMMDIWLLFALTLTRGIITAFNRPSRMTVVYALVGRDLLSSALAFNSMIFNSSRFVGPAIGGAIMAGLSTGWAFVAAAITILLFSLALAVIRIGAMPPRESKGETLVAEAIEGLRYAFNHAGISLQLWILVLAALFARPITDLLPGFTAAIFERGPDGLALFLTFHGVGATVGGLWLTSRSGGVKGMTNVMIFSLLLMATALLIYSQLSNFWIGCLLVAVIGASFSIQGISNQTLIQYAVDPAYRGRVGSVYGAIARGAPALGALIMGVVADQVGLRSPVAAGAVLCLMLVLWSWRRRKTMAAALESEPAPNHRPGRAAD